MSENDERGNRWETPADPEAAVAPVEGAVSIEVPAAPIEGPAEPAAAVAAPARESRMPSWMSTRGLIASGAVAAIFLGGGGVGYAIGAHGHGDDRQFPGRFDRAGFNGQLPGGRQGPGYQQVPPGQSQGQFQGQSQGQSRGQSQSGSGTSS